MGDEILPDMSRCDFIISHHMGAYVGILHKVHGGTAGYSQICAGMITRKKWDSVIQSRAPVYYISLIIRPSVTQYDHIWVSSISDISSHHILPGNNQFSLGVTFSMPNPALLTAHCVRMHHDAVMHQTGLVQWTWKITSISNDPDAKDEHDGASS